MVEDPIEYMIEGISQTQVNTRVGMTFARGLRAILRLKWSTKTGHELEFFQYRFSDSFGGTSNGKERILGIPTVSDRIAQGAIKLFMEEKLDPIFMLIHMVTDQANQLMML